MLIEETCLPSVKTLTLMPFGDHHGFLSESWNSRILAAQGIGADFVEDTHSLSMQLGVAHALQGRAGVGQRLGGKA